MSFKPFSLVMALVAASLLGAAEIASSHDEAALEYLRAKGTPELLERHCKLMLEKQLAAAPEYAEHREALAKFYRDTFGFEALKDDLVKLYTAEYSEAELRELARFYSSELGRKSVAVEEKLIPAFAELLERRAKATVKAQARK
ncbi:MAG: DUF2059 domain-containing protein [Bacteroidales bacterium]|nr:DUF2059 domain-containing protein [Bacteroidales bacterium]